MDYLDQIKEILMAHCGKCNRITSAQIASLIGISEDATYAKTRDLILRTAKKFKLPLVADNRGYYLITTKKDLEAYIDNLDKRIAGINERKRIIAENYREWKK